MPVSPLPHLRHAVSAVLSLALALGVLALLLAAPSQALAKARGSACLRPTGTHTKRRASGCARSGRRSKNRHARHAARHHAARPAVTKARHKTRAKKAPSSLPPVTSAPAAASCEDGSEPVQVEAETYECTDGSEPGCEDGSELTVSGDGARLACAGDRPEGDGSGEAECQAVLTLPEGEKGSSGPADDATPVCSATPEGPEAGWEADD